LYVQLSDDLSSFETQILAEWNGQPYPVVFSTELDLASCSLGVALLSPQHYQMILLQMNQLKALGISAVTIPIHFPLFYAPYYQGSPQLQQYVDFYTRLSRDIRAAGLKLIVENQVMFPPTSQHPQAARRLVAFYKSLSWDDYIIGRAQNALVIAQTVAPDYLTVLSEPITEARQTGQLQIDSADGAAAMVQGILNVLRPSIPATMKIGAGVGTWDPYWLQIATALSQNTTMDYLNLDLYPLGASPDGTTDFTTRAVQMADIARASGKPTAIGQGWLYKARLSELTSASAFYFFARDPFSFWAPLDQRYLKAVVDLAHWKQFEFVSPFWSQYFFAYLDYDSSTATLSANEIRKVAQTAEVQAMNAGQFTSTGNAFLRYITPGGTAP